MRLQSLEEDMNLILQPDVEQRRKYFVSSRLKSALREDRNFALEMMEIVNQANVEHSDWVYWGYGGGVDNMKMRMKRERLRLEELITGGQSDSRAVFYQDELNRITELVERSGHIGSSARGARNVWYGRYLAKCVDFYMSNLTLSELREERSKIEKRVFNMASNISSEHLIDLWMNDMRRMDQYIVHASMGKKRTWWPNYVRFLNQEIMVGKEPPRLDIQSCKMMISTMGSTVEPSVLRAGDVLVIDILEARDQYGDVKTDETFEVRLVPESNTDDAPADQQCLDSAIILFDQRNQCYRAQFEIVKVTRCRITLDYDGKVIMDRLLPPIQPGSVQASTCRLVKQLPMELEAGLSYDIEVETLDKFGNMSSSSSTNPHRDIRLTVMFDDGSGPEKYLDMDKISNGLYRTSISINADHVGGSCAWDVRLLDSSDLPFISGVSLLPRSDSHSFDASILRIKGKPRPSKGIRFKPIQLNFSVDSDIGLSTPTSLEDPAASPSVFYETETLNSLRVQSEDSMGPLSDDLETRAIDSRTSIPLPKSRPFSNSTIQRAIGSRTNSPSSAPSNIRKTLYLSVLGWKPPSNLEELVRQYASTLSADVVTLAIPGNNLNDQCESISRSLRNYPSRNELNHLILCHERPATQSLARNYGLFLDQLNRVSKHVVHVITDQEDHWNALHRGKAYWGAQFADHTSGVFLKDTRGKEKRGTLYFVVSNEDNTIQFNENNDTFLDNLKDMVTRILVHL